MYITIESSKLQKPAAAVFFQSYQRFGSSKSGGDIKVSYSCIMLFSVAFSTIMVLNLESSDVVVGL